jgi:hypothetical protein
VWDDYEGVIEMAATKGVIQKRSGKMRGIKCTGGVSRVESSKRSAAIRRGEIPPMEYTMSIEEALVKVGLR